MNRFISVLILVGVTLSFPISVILFTMNKAVRSVTRLLAIAFFSIGCYALSHFLFLTEWILECPMYYRLVTPFYYLIPPCIYFYVYQLLRLNGKPVKNMWLHFIPAMIMLIDILPWIFASYQERYEAVRSIVVDHVSIFNVAQGFMPIWMHFVARPLLGIVYLYFQLSYILRVRSRHANKFRSGQYRRVYKWVFTLTMIEMVMYLSLTSFSIAMLMNLHNAQFLIRMIYLPAMLMCISFIVSAFYLYFTPNLLYGYELVPYKLTLDAGQMLPRGYVKVESVKMHEFDLSAAEVAEYELREITGGSVIQNDMVLAPYSREAIERYRRCLEDELMEAELFKRQGLTVHQLTKMCDVPSRALSFLLTNIYKKRFNDFINEYRVQYIVSRLRNDDWRGITLEGLALEAGFSSRTTFFLAFKKIHQMSPSQYVANLEKEAYRGA